MQVIIPRKGINDEGKGKKFALHKLISAATDDYVWLQDDDIVPPVATPALDADLIILPLRMAEGSGSLFCRLQQAEYAALQQVTMETAKKNRPVMCSGANLIVKRELWLEAYADLHPEVPSGDDMFLLETAKRRGWKIGYADGPEYEAVVTPKESLRELLHQRMRWAGKAPLYTDKDILRYGSVVLVANLIQLTCPAILLIKFPYEYTLIKKRDPKVSLWIALLLEILYPYYMLICLLCGLFRRSSW